MDLALQSVTAAAGRRKAALRRKAAFTLIELMVAIAIIGLGMTIVFLKVDTLLPGSRLQASCKEIVTQIENLRSRAIFRGIPVTFEYDIDANGYSAYFSVVFDDEGEVSGAGITEIIEFDGLAETVEITDLAMGYVDEEENISTKQAIHIRPDGTITGHIVHLKNIDSGEEMSVRFSSLTGFAEVLEGRIDYEEINDDSF